MDEDRFVPLEDLKSTVVFVPPASRKWRVKELSLSVRLRHTLGHLGCKSLGDLQGMTFGKVLKSPGCGVKTVRELEQYPRNVGLGKAGMSNVEEATRAPKIQLLTRNLWQTTSNKLGTRGKLVHTRVDE